MASYSKEHKPSQCDKCLKDVGEQNLYKMPFLYCDKNDHVHEDVSWMLNMTEGEGYRQYYGCKKCYDIQVKIIKKQNGEWVETHIVGEKRDTKRID